MGQLFLGDEVGFLEGDEGAETGFDGRGIFVEFVAVEGVTHFSAEGIA